MRIAKVLPVACVGPILCSCTFPHPLQEDVTRLPHSAIIRKITCEAKDALDDLLSQQGYGQAKRAEYKEANRNLSALTKKILKPRQDETKELERRKQELDFADAANRAEQEALLIILERNPKYPGVKKRIVELILSIERYYRDKLAYIQALKQHNRDLAIAKRRVDAAKRETEARFKELSRYYSQQMAYSFRFKAVETDILTTGPSSYKLPLNLGTLTIGLSATDTKKRDGERRTSLLISFEDLHGTPCEDAPANVDRIRAMHYPIKGKIGVHEVLAQYLKILDRAKDDQKRDSAGEDEAEKARKIFDKTDAYVDTIIFTTTLTGTVTPSITLNPTTKEQLTASPGITGTREDTHTVTISLSPSDSSGESKEVEKISKVQEIKTDLLVPQ